ncbi:MAG: BatA domain-containing protein [Saprospiraceae bacterium]|nr:BatA domain-containing protein [Saprospiraceae bacterium]
MQFLFPAFLFALAAIAIPIIIHLFHFRRFKTVYFTNVRFLREVKEETSNRRKIRDLLVLLARCLAISMLVLAFAQPFLPRNTEGAKKGEQAVSIFLDNSFSMNALSKDLPLLEKAKQKAREIVQAYANHDKFQILTNDFEGRHQRLVSKEEALTFIDEVKTTPSVQELSKVIQRQQQALNTGQAPNKTAFVLSDFQKNVTDIPNIKDTTLEVNLIPLAAVQEKNIAIDSAWFESPVQMMGQTNPLVVRVTNYTNENAENVKLSLKLDGQDKPVGLLNIKAHSSVEDTINITILRTGWHEADLSITDYPVQFDDHLFFTFNVPPQINVLVISDGGGNRFLESAMAGVRSFKVVNQSSGNVQYSQFPQYQMIVLSNLVSVSSGLAAELTQYIKNGGNVTVFPAPSVDLTSYTNFFNTAQANIINGFDNTPREVAGINLDEFVFRDVFTNKNVNMKLPSTTGNYRLTNRNGENLLTYRDGSSFVTKNRIGQGNIYICAAPLDDKVSTLARSGEVFVPMLYKMAISSAKEWKIGYTIGKDDFIEADSKGIAGEKAYKMKGAKEEFIPEQRIVAAKAILGVKEGIKEAGFYNLFTKPDSVLYKYGFNFDRRESVLDYYDVKSLKTYERKNLKVFDETVEANFTAIVGEHNQGVTFWRWCLILALLFLAIEVGLLRFWKV